MKQFKRKLQVAYRSTYELREFINLLILVGCIITSPFVLVSVLAALVGSGYGYHLLAFAITIGLFSVISVILDNR